jgi:hypothetical protein
MRRLRSYRNRFHKNYFSTQKNMIAVKIKVSKINKSLFYQHKDKPDGTKGDQDFEIVLFENKDGKSDYGDDGYACQSLSAEQRAKGVKAPIIGNWRHLGQTSNAAPASPPPAARPAPNAPARRPAPAPAPRNDFADDDSTPF